jgi:predicted 3-demethylubiquinone-9 3-methyltransferase (glyoxalase superfamily)
VQLSQRLLLNYDGQKDTYSMIVYPFFDDHISTQVLVDKSEHTESLFQGLKSHIIAKSQFDWVNRT